jgi:chromosome segregation ATPase
MLLDEYDRLLESSQRIQASYDDTVSSYRRIESELSGTVEAYERLDSTLAETLASYQRLEETLAETVDSFRRLEMQYSDALTEAAASRDEAATLRAGVVDMSGDLDRMRQEARRLRAELEAYEASTSWRLTAPFRSGVDRLRAASARRTASGSDG